MTSHRVLGFAAAILLAGTLIAMIIAMLPQPGAEATGPTTTDLEARVASLEDAIALHQAELRAHEEKILALEALMWREPGKVAQAVVDRLWERASSCQDNDACYYGDPLLYAFYHIPLEERHPYIITLIVEGNWHAEQTGECPQCHSEGNSFRNYGRNHWFACERCGVAWCNEDLPQWRIPAHKPGVKLEIELSEYLAQVLAGDGRVFSYNHGGTGPSYPRSSDFSMGGSGKRMA